MWSKKIKKHIYASLGIIYNSDKSKVLISKRRLDQMYSGHWEIPGGKIEQNESPKSAIIRELNEELGIEVIDLKFLDTVNYEYPDIIVNLEVFRILKYSGEAYGKEGQEISWVSLDELKGLPDLLEASHAIIELL